MGTKANVEVIKKLYADFSRGDIDAIMAVLDDDVRWEEPDHPEIPYGGSRRGKPAVGEFFKGVAQVEVASFEPQEFVATGDHVMAIGSWSGKARPTGKPFHSDWVMNWEVRDGRVKSFHGYEDSAAIVDAFRR